ncbi:MAG TPA: hypothetical protein VJJ20_01545 [Candidatus Paceibacterota bacterium]
MSTGMLGRLPLSALRGPKDDLDNLLAGTDGESVLAEFKKFVKRQPCWGPTAFERNEHGHIIVTVTGLDLTGAEEIERLEAAGYVLSDYFKSCLLSKKKDSYDKNHRLVAGQSYRLALMPGKEIKRDADRTTDALRKRGMQMYAYGKPLGGMVPRIRESVSDKQMEEMGFWYITGLHDPIKDSGGDPRVLNSSRSGDGRWLGAVWVHPGNQWVDVGAFAFPVPASST